MSDPIFPLAVWESGTNQNSIPANDNALRVEAISRGALGVANDEAGGDSDGDVWIVGDSPTGAFSSFTEDDIAIYKGGTWYAWAPVFGLRLYVEDELEVYEAGWSAIGGGGGGAVSSVNGATGAVNTFGNGLDVDATGFRGIPQNSQSGNYTTVAADAGKEIYHPSGAGAGDTFTIDSNANVAYEVGTAITFTNMDSNALTIAITSDTLYLAGTGSTGSRTLAQYGTATAVKKNSTTWLVSGIGLT